MAASANPSGNNQQESSRNGNGAAANDGGSAPHENSAVAATQAALRHNPGISVEWTTDEQSLLEELLTKSVILPLSLYIYILDVRAHAILQQQ